MQPTGSEAEGRASTNSHPIPLHSQLSAFLFLFGITPTALYAEDAPNEDTVKARVAPLHQNKRPLPDGVPQQLGPNPPNDQANRVPRITADLLGARPVDLGIIDGVDTIRNGEGF